MVKTCTHFEILADPVTKTPYKSFCTTEVKTGTVCLRHRPPARFPRRRNYGPPRFPDESAAKRFDADDIR